MPELIVIFIVAILILGPTKLPAWGNLSEKRYESS
jgi:Sec-independent protein translocase protein TatA